LLPENLLVRPRRRLVAERVVVAERVKALTRRSRPSG